MNIIMKRVRLKDGTDVYRVPEKLAVVLVKTNQYVYATRAVEGKRSEPERTSKCLVNF